MADLLNHAPGAHVFHEPVLEDFYAHVRAHYSTRDAEKYMQGFRKKEIFNRMRNTPPGVYGEVNGTLRCHAPVILKAFPGATLIHMVRDGREVIRSTAGRRTMTFKNPFSMMLHPTASDPWHSRWDSMDRFARICWLWQEENRRLRTTIGKTVQFEKILSDYEYFRTQVLAPCHIQLDKSVWEVAVATPRNITHKFQMPKWDEWTPEEKATFSEICGDEMAKCGYTL